MNISGQVSVNSAWVNAYKSNQSHDLHDHLPCQFSAVHYLKYNPEVHTPTIFVNPYRQVSVSSSPRHESFIMDQIPAMWHQQSTLDVEEGDATLAFYEKSNRYHKEFSEKFKITDKSDWYKLNKKEEDFFNFLVCTTKEPISISRATWLVLGSA